MVSPCFRWRSLVLRSKHFCKAYTCQSQGRGCQTGLGKEFHTECNTELCPFQQIITKWTDTYPLNGPETRSLK